MEWINANELDMQKWPNFMSWESEILSWLRTPQSSISQKDNTPTSLGKCHLVPYDLYSWASLSWHWMLYFGRIFNRLSRSVLFYCLPMTGKSGIIVIIQLRTGSLGRSDTQSPTLPRTSNEALPQVAGGASLPLSSLITYPFLVFHSGLFPSDFPDQERVTTLHPERKDTAPAIISSEWDRPTEWADADYATQTPLWSNWYG